MNDPNGQRRVEGSDRSSSLARVAKVLAMPRKVYTDLLRLRGGVLPLLSKLYLRRACGKEFCPQSYLDLNPDVAAAGIDPYTHYARHGRAEGRLTKVPDIEVMGESLGKARELVLVVSHEGSRTGAPILSYNLVLQLLKKYDVIALFLGPGPLLAACRTAGAVVVGPFPNAVRISPSIADLIVRHLTAAGPVKFAIVNSIESRWLLPALARSHVATVSLIHEFAAYTRPHGAFREAVIWSGQTVFSSSITRDDAVAVYPDLADREYPVIPQGRCTLPPGDEPRERDQGEEARIERVMRPRGFPADGLVVLGAGAVQFRKGVDLFIDCAARVRRKLPAASIRFVWVGKGYDPCSDVAYSVYLADQIRRAGLEGCVHFLDEVVDLEAVYARASVLLLSSRLDPLPNVAIDALAHRLPVVCFDRTTGMADLLRNHGLDEACVAPYLDTEDAAAKIVALARSPERRAEIAERSANLAATFDMVGYVERIERLALEYVERTLQEQRDVETIAASDLPRLDFLLPPHSRDRKRNGAVAWYVRGWASGISRRKTFPGFHPGIYRERHGVARPGVDPLADYLRAGQPPGPWTFDLVTSTERPIPLPPAFRVALHVHAYYAELFPELLTRLELNRVRPDLLVSVGSRFSARMIESHLRSYAGAVTIREVPNRGRDIGPFLTEFAEVLQGYDVVGHVHTKKAADLEGDVGRVWYEFLLQNLVGGDATMADAILGRMAQDSEIGIVFPDDPHACGWNRNLPFVEPFFPALGIEGPYREIAFPIGTMFWARPAALKRMFALRLGWTDYPAEPLPYDGSLLHGLERVFGLVVMGHGSRVALTHVAGRTR